MRQNKYGVYLTRDGVDVNDWMTRSTTLGQIGNSALSCYNYKSGTPSLLYIPKNEFYGANCFPEPLFLNLSNGNYAYSSKTGFIHAVFGNDAFSSDSYEERFAADYIGSKAFTVTLSEDEARKIPSEKYSLGERGYLDISADSMMADVIFPEDFNDIAFVLDGLMSGKNTVVLGDSYRVLSALVNALKILPSAEGANTVSFNTAATTAEAAKLSRLNGGSYLKSDAINNLKNAGCYIADLNADYDINRLLSSTARIVCEERSCDPFKDDCPQGATNCPEFLSAVESAARRYELNKLSDKYVNGSGCSGLTEWEISHYLNLYNACVNDLRRQQYGGIRSDAEDCLRKLAANVLFSKKFFTVDQAQITMLSSFMYEVPAPQQDVSADLAEYGTIDGLVRFMQMCNGYAEAGDTNSNNAARWLCELFMSEQPNAKNAAKRFADGLKEEAFLRFVKLLDVNCDLFVANHPYSSGQMLIKKLFADFKSESELRKAYGVINNSRSRNTVWLLEKAYVSIENVEDLENWVQAADGLNNTAFKALAAQFARAFQTFLTKNPVNQKNFSAYRRAADKFNYRNDVMMSAISRIENSANSQMLFDRRLEDNLRSRREFVMHERKFLTRQVKEDGEVEKEVYGSLFSKSHFFGGAYLLWLFAALAIGVVAAGIAVLVKDLLNLPWAEFFVTLRHPIKGVPINALLTGVPFALSVAVSMLSYVFGKRECKGLVRSSLCTLFIVVLPYLAFVLTCGAVYYLL